MVLGSALLMVLVSLTTRPPTPATIAKYFPQTQTQSTSTQSLAASTR
jgi:hypothetical protein